MIVKPAINRHRSRVPRYASALVAMGALGLLLTACSGGGSAASTTTPSASKGTGGASLSAFRQCLAQHGVTLPNFSGGGSPPSGSGTPPSGGSGPGEGGAPPTGSGGAPGGGFANNPKFAAAAKACASVEPKGGFGGGGAANSSAFAAYRNCLKLHGVTLPSTTSGSTPSSIDTSTAAYKAAQTACAALAPKTGSAPPSTASPATG